MTEKATGVVTQPVSLVESLLWDITTWHDFLTEVSDIRKVATDRFAFTLSLRRGSVSVPVAVHHHPRDRRFTWRSLQGPEWFGELRMRPMNGRRTRVGLWVSPLQEGPSADRGQDLERLLARFKHLPQPVHPGRLQGIDRSADQLPGVLTNVLQSVKVD